MIVDDDTLYDWQKPSETKQPGRGSSTLPPGAAEYLVQTNPRLADLQRHYAAFNSDVTTPLIWTDSHLGPEDMLYFRGDNAYVWQVRSGSMNIVAYALTTYYLRSIDELGLLDKLEEDSLFGVHSFMIDGKPVSRDLLDSVAEIYFLDKYLNISSHQNLSFLDIGAGYGRLAHRMTDSLPNILQYLCTDAIPNSTFISDYYLKFRRAEEKARAVPLDEIEQALSCTPIDIAINIHSFSECRPSAIEWWLSLLAENSVRHLMIVPNTGDRLRTNDGFDFTSIVEKHGYRLIAKEPKYRDPIVQQYGINPAFHYLFELG
jgi:hypothetical protein